MLTGSGTAAAYHAGVVKALDESGVKVDLIVGSGAGTIAAAFSAIAGSARLYGADGFWAGVRWSSFYRLRLAARLGALLLASSYGLFVLPLVLAIVGFVFLFLPALIADLFLPGIFGHLLGQLAAAPVVVRGYLVALSVPVFALCAFATIAALRVLIRDRRRFSESLESLLDAERGRDRLSRALWEIARGPALSDALPGEAELGRRYVALAAENLGQPGFRELILRAADLETGGALGFVLLQDAHRNSFAASRSRGPRSRVDGMPDAIDLRAPGGDALFFDAVMTGLLPPLVAPVRRVAFPKGGLHGGETHRLTDATLVSGCGLGEALAAGAEQVIVVSPTPEQPAPPARRRGRARRPTAPLRCSSGRPWTGMSPRRNASTAWFRRSGTTLGWAVPGRTRPPAACTATSRSTSCAPSAAAWGPSNGTAHATRRPKCSRLPKT